MPRKPTYKRTEPDPDLKEFGQVMNKHRNRANLEARDIADRLGVSCTSVHNWEAGMTSPPLLKAMQWCKILRLDLWPSEPGTF